MPSAGPPQAAKSRRPRPLFDANSVIQVRNRAATDDARYYGPCHRRATCGFLVVMVFLTLFYVANLVGEPVRVWSTSAAIREVAEGDGIGGYVSGKRVDLRIKVRDDGGQQSGYTKVEWRYDGNDFGCRGLAGETTLSDDPGTSAEVPLCYSFLDLTILDSPSWGMSKLEDILLITSTQSASVAIQFGHGPNDNGMSVRPVLGKRYRVRQRVSMQRTAYTGTMNVGTELRTTGMDYLGPASSNDVFECLVTLEGVAVIESFRLSVFTILGTVGGLYTALLGVCTVCVQRCVKPDGHPRGTRGRSLTHPVNGGEGTV
jgi:hypothetical protein